MDDPISMGDVLPTVKSIRKFTLNDETGLMLIIIIGGIILGSL